MHPDHRAFAKALRAQVHSGSGLSAPGLLQQTLEKASGGSPLPAPIDALAGQIAEAAYRVSDSQVAAVRAEAGSDKATFEIVMAAAIGAGLMRWDRAIALMDEAD